MGRRIRRPTTATSPAFDLAYVRTGPPSMTPALVIPGGPGLASELPYRAFRRTAANGGLDLLMVEHRGVGLSRRDVDGRLLPRSAMRLRDVVDDLVAVLDAEGADRAFVVGSSYGSYVAAAFAAWHPDRVEGLLLDSTLQPRLDLADERAAVRGLFWDADDGMTADIRALVGRGEDQRVLLDVIRAAYELVGARLVRSLVAERLRGIRSLAWRALELYATRDGSTARIPYVYDFDLVGVIAFRELDYGAAPDGLPLDPALTYAPVAPRYPPYVGAPLDVAASARGFAFPTVLMTGARDLRTPAAIARGVADAAPDAVLVELDNGHSALDSHPVALLNALRMLMRGQQDRLPGLASTLDALPRRGAVARFAQALAATVRR